MNNRRMQIYKRRRRKKRVLAIFLISFILIISIVSINIIKKGIKSYVATKNVEIMNADEINIVEEENDIEVEKEERKAIRNELIYILEDTSLEDEIRNNLISLYAEYPEIETIINNIDNYPEELIETVARNPEVIEYALSYLENYPSQGTGEEISIEDDYVEGKIPLFLQWDKRWGYYKYGEEYPIAINGCGPTALAMVIVGLTGDTCINPKVISDFSYENGYLVSGQGTSWSLISEGATQFGLSVKELSLAESVIKSTLRKGIPIIASMRPGDFTTTGHFIVLTGVTDEGKIKVNDSNSVKRSNKEWDIDVFMKQTKNLWALYKSNY